MDLLARHALPGDVDVAFENREGCVSTDAHPFLPPIAPRRRGSRPASGRCAPQIFLCQKVILPRIAQAAEKV